VSLKTDRTTAQQTAQLEGDDNVHARLLDCNRTDASCIHKPSTDVTDNDGIAVTGQLPDNPTRRNWYMDVSAHGRLRLQSPL